MSEPPRLAPPSCAGTAVPAGRSSAAFGTRFFILASLGFVWLGPAWASAKFIYLMVLWDALIVALWAWDLLRVLPPPDRIEIRRSWPAAPRLATPGRVELHARCADTVAGELQMTLVDDVPASFCRTPPALEATVSAGRPETVSYDILPTERGDFPLGSVFIRYRGRLGLA
ncbi:MAG TPA: hypothetical protein VFG76_02150, partial [Candidatus Polarisedimenticolia bacterium]|nr:hypothetical protein [Candidatus Polarisedimenticolia bacterium]